MIAESTAVGGDKVSSLKSSWPGVSSEIGNPPQPPRTRAKVITLEVTEMPRACSIFIPVRARAPRSLRALTSPTGWIAPPFSSKSFSVKVVLPASGVRDDRVKVRRVWAALVAGRAPVAGAALHITIMRAAPEAYPALTPAVVRRLPTPLPNSSAQSPFARCSLAAAARGRIFPLSPVDESRLHNLDDSGFIEARRCRADHAVQKLDATTIKGASMPRDRGAAFSLKVEPAETASRA